MRWLCVVILCTLVGCDGDDPSDGGPGDDPAFELGPEDCPVNSGWPCTCTRRSTPCDDGAICAIVAQGQGICAAECIPGQPPGSACPDDGFPGHPYCQLRESPSSPPTHCLLSCAHSSACPSDQECQNISGTTGVGQCLP